MRDHTHFGYRDVPLSDKQELVDDVFHKVARRYDLMNDLMSGGLHRAWKDAMVTTLALPHRRPCHIVDVAGGTGDIAFRILERSARTSVTIIDINDDMLAVGRRRASRRYD